MTPSELLKQLIDSHDRTLQMMEELNRQHELIQARLARLEKDSAARS